MSRSRRGANARKGLPEIVAAAFLFVLAAGSVVVAGEAPGKRYPGGFRDLAWGMRFEEARAIYPDLEVREKVSGPEGDVWECRRGKEDRVSGPVTFDAIDYRFTGGGFDGILATVRNAHGDANPTARRAFDHYRSVVASRFGEPSAQGEAQDRNAGGEAYALWRGGGTRIMTWWKADEGGSRKDVFRLEIRRSVSP